MPRPASDHRPHRRLGERRAPRQRQRVIERGGEVIERIDERAIEVEADDRKRKTHGRTPLSVRVERSRDTHRDRAVLWGISTSLDANGIDGPHGAMLWKPQCFAGMATRMSNPIAAIILAPGTGTRMKSDLHKVLTPQHGKA